MTTKELIKYWKSFDLKDFWRKVLGRLNES